MTGQVCNTYYNANNTPCRVFRFDIDYQFFNTGPDNATIGTFTTTLSRVMATSTLSNSSITAPIFSGWSGGYTARTTHHLSPGYTNGTQIADWFFPAYNKTTMPDGLYQLYVVFDNGQPDNVIHLNSEISVVDGVQSFNYSVLSTYTTTIPPYPPTHLLDYSWISMLPAFMLLAYKNKK